jgi:hypothetical protein
MAVTCRDKQLVDILLKKNMINPRPNVPKTLPAREKKAA